MNMFQRTLIPYIKDDLKTKMVFIGGPRQVGKTTLALSLLASKSKSDPAYLNWDISRNRKSILRMEYPGESKLLIFDEIHKYSRWKAYMKGFFDEYVPNERNALVTGSARMNLYQRGGDSLLGRYHYYHLHPLSPLEISANPTRGDLRALINFSGFPEPFCSGNERNLRRWQRDRVQLLLNEDIRDLERVKDIALLEILADALPDRVGSPLSVRSLQEDLQVAHDTVKRWLLIFERIYLTFRISPYGTPKIRAVKKEQKLYFWDWTQVLDDGARFENFVASQLLRYCHFHENVNGHKMELRYIRDIDGRELDFVVLKDNKPEFAVECKLGERSLTKYAEYFKMRTPIPLIYQVHTGEQDQGDERKLGRVLPIEKFVKQVLQV